MNPFLPIAIIFLLCSNVYGQKIQELIHGIPSDSSFYHVTRVSSNEFWAGGEFGILKRIDTLGNFSELNFPNEGLNILKIEKVGWYVYVVTENAVIFRYDMIEKTFVKREFPELRNRCFYDVIVLKNGQLLLCGGATMLTHTKKILPHGYVAIMDEEMKEIKTVWKSWRKFVWSLSELENGDILAAVFNGLNTHIIKTPDLNKWKSEFRVKGLVHEIAYFGNQLWYSGTRNLQLHKDGIMGPVTTDKSPAQYYKTGCLWSMDAVEGNIVSVSQNGSLLMIDKITNESRLETIPNAYILYDMEKISGAKYLIVGNGKSAYIIDFSLPLVPGSSVGKKEN